MTDNKKPDPQSQRQHDDEADRAITSAGMLANLSHEMRTPLDAILGYVELLSETSLSDQQAAYAAAVENAAQGLLDIMDDVLSLARLRSGKFSIHSQPFSLRDCIDSVAQMLAPSAYSKNLDFIRLVDPDVPTNLVGDPLRIRQILVNLVGNAIKFTHQGQVRLRVTAHPFDDERYELVIRVSDTGIGLTKTDIESLFQPFSRPAAPTSEISGTGLGLVITRSLCEAMGGSIAVHSTPAVGSTFCVRIPLRPAEEPFHFGAGDGLLTGRTIVVVCGDSELATAVSAELQKEGASTRVAGDLPTLSRTWRESDPTYDAAVLVLGANQLRQPDALVQQWQPLRGRLPILCLANSGAGHTLREVGKLFGGEALPAHCPIQSISEHLATILRQSTTTQHAERDDNNLSLGDLRILIAEDNQFGREYLDVLLTRHGASVDTCADGETACRMIAERTYDLVLMDVRMPHCDGVTAMQRLSESWSGDPPIIGLTAAPEDCCRALAAGMTDCLLKPLRPSVLLKYINQHREEAGSTARAEPAFLDREMKQELRAELPRRATLLRDSITSGQLTSALEQAHKINGIAALCGFDQLRSTAASVESMIRQQQLDGIERLSRDLRREVDRVLATLMPG